ncbi:hypothetical protein P175DRAFT_0481567 [Aspergillus ochraceoroseus IBT 24754]|uniref:Uncharacterized protein n=1 Tax=Aspergillus ochraceoroseus IBT 24754 TaxID=1392256 RepID=A0A2T5LVL3_9EURO|nr:uncharacterized protein P175DRAFT_0481567 [Aspergillus ochraceoroseus IBT 24754]PTU20322.1 hypothetical protein P175DRAFT_0481567 [Aspergillus ochraceoroseus IBT 24754]
MADSYTFPKWDDFSFPRYAGSRLASQVAQVLDTAGVPNVLWGSLAMNVLGCPEVGEDTQLIIPDRFAQAATDAISVAGLNPCPHGSTCGVIKGRDEPYPNTHFHINEDEVTQTVDFYRKSSLIWSLPDMKPGNPSTNDRTYILASDARHPVSHIWKGGTSCGSGPFPNNFPPVKILTKIALVEALILLCCRDFDSRNPQRGVWIDALSSMATFVVRDPDPKELDPRFSVFWKCIKERESKTACDILGELRAGLLMAGELPPPPKRADD